MNRTPPAEVRRLLRKEVGFGCPVAGCDSPYLSWQHFEPPWEERQHHEPKGMVALCVLHHGQADARAFTVDQLRAFKDRDLNGAERRLRGDSPITNSCGVRPRSKSTDLCSPALVRFG